MIVLQTPAVLVRQEKNSSVVILDEEVNKIRHEQQKNLSDMRLSQPQELEEELTKFIESTGNNMIFSQKEDDVGSFSVFILNLFPKAYQQLRTSEKETYTSIPTNMEEFASSVPLLSYRKLPAPNGCETGGTWGTIRYFGFNTRIMCLYYTCSIFGPFGLLGVCVAGSGPLQGFVRRYPQDRRLVYLVNGRIYDKQGDLLGKEEDLSFQPKIEEIVGQTISRR